MVIIVTKKDQQIFVGNIRKTARLIKVAPITISRWIASEDRIVHKNGFDVYLKVELL